MMNVIGEWIPYFMYGSMFIGLFIIIGIGVYASYCQLIKAQNLKQIQDALLIILAIGFIIFFTGKLMQLITGIDLYGNNHYKISRLDWGLLLVFLFILGRRNKEIDKDLDNDTNE